jgi:hypothetical protein
MLAASLLRIRYGSEDDAVVAGVPPARLELQPTRLPLQKLSIQRVEDNAFHLIEEKPAHFLKHFVEFRGRHL